MPTTLTPTDAIEALTEARERTLALVAGVGDEDLERVHSTLMSPLVWDLGHIAASRTCGSAIASAACRCSTPTGRGLRRLRDAPRGPRRAALPASRRGASLPRRRPRPHRRVSSATAIDDRLIPELIIRHEHQHTETMLQTLELARLPGFEPTPPAAAAPAGPTRAHRA